MSSFTDSSDYSVPITDPTHPFDDEDTYISYNSQPFDDSFASGNDFFVPQTPIYGNSPSKEDGEIGGSDGPILSPPSEMMAEEGFVVREWRRQNMIELEKKEKRERELRSQIIKEADDYKVEFYKKREIACEYNKSTNREKEKLFLVHQEKFHAEADDNYWKSIAELIPNEVPAIEKKGGKRDQEKKPAIVVIQGPKHGKPTELSRMRQIVLKLRHSTPPHLKHSPTPAAVAANDAKISDAAAATTLNAATVVTAPEPVAVA